MIELVGLNTEYFIFLSTTVLVTSCDRSKTGAIVTSIIAMFFILVQINGVTLLE